MSLLDFFGESTGVDPNLSRADIMEAFIPVFFKREEGSFVSCTETLFLFGNLVPVSHAIRPAELGKKMNAFAEHGTFAPKPAGQLFLVPAQESIPRLPLTPTPAPASSSATPISASSSPSPSPSSSSSSSPVTPPDKKQRAMKIAVRPSNHSVRSGSETFWQGLSGPHIQQGTLSTNAANLNVITFPEPYSDFFRKIGRVPRNLSREIFVELFKASTQLSEPNTKNLETGFADDQINKKWTVCFQIAGCIKQENFTASIRSVGDVTTLEITGEKFLPKAIVGTNLWTGTFSGKATIPAHVDSATPPAKDFQNGLLFFVFSHKRVTSQTIVPPENLFQFNLLAE